MALSTCTKCGEQPTGCGCETPYTTAPACLPVDPCSNPEPCSEFFDAECIIYSGDTIWCGTDQVVLKNDRLGTSIINIVTYFCTQIATINSSLTTINLTLVSLQDQIDALGSTGTPFNLFNSSIDAGDDKTSDIVRSGRVWIEEDDENRTVYAKNGMNAVGNNRTFVGLATASDTQAPEVQMVRWRGTYFSALNLLDKDTLGFLSFKTGVTTQTGVFLKAIATENHVDDTNYGAGFEFWGIRKTTINARKILTIDADTGLTISSETVDFGKKIGTFGSGLKPFIEFENTSGTEFSKGYLSINDILGLISAKSKAGELGKALFSATQNHTVANGGTKFEVYVTPNNSISQALGLKIDQDGSVSFRNYTFPSADGTVNQVIKTDGAGNLSWSTPITGVTSSGTNNYLARFNPDGQALVNSLIQDNGATIGVNISPFTSVQLFVFAPSTSVGTTIFSRNQSTGSYSQGVIGESFGNGNTNIGVEGRVIDGSGNLRIGGWFRANDGTSNYSVQLQDNTEGAGKFLKSVTSDGKANWAQITKADITDGISSNSGIINVLPKWTPDGTTLGNSQIEDDGTNIGVNVTPLANYRFRVNSSTDTYTLTGNNTNTSGGVGVFANTSGATVNTNIGGISNASNSTTLNIGHKGDATQSTAGTNVGGWFRAGTGALNYAVRLDDGSQGLGQVLVDITGNGHSNWAKVDSTYTTGATGSFTSNDGKTITVTNGLITSIV